MSITIDGTSYDVPIIKINRKVETLDKYAERTQDGVLHRELIGVYYNYDLSMGMSRNNVTDYANLVLKLSEPEEFHTVVIPAAPSGYSSFTCYFANVQDEVARYNKDGVDYFRNLSFSVISQSPSRTP